MIFVTISYFFFLLKILSHLLKAEHKVSHEGNLTSNKERPTFPKKCRYKTGLRPVLAPLGGKAATARIGALCQGRGIDFDVNLARQTVRVRERRV